MSCISGRSALIVDCTTNLEKLSSIEDRGQTDHISAPTRAGLRLVTLVRSWCGDNKNLLLKHWQSFSNKLINAHELNILLVYDGNIHVDMTVSAFALALHTLLFVPPSFLPPFLYLFIFVFFCLFRRPV